VVDQCLAARPGVKLVTEKQHTPGQPADGAYQAVLEVD
jgi:hypothetical protein